MFFIISKLLAFLTQPIVWVSILILIAIIYKKKRKSFLIYALFLLYFFSNGFVFDELSRLWEPKQKTIIELEKKYDVAYCGLIHSDEIASYIESIADTNYFFSNSHMRN